uniref:Acid phosphatase 1-like n=1 Tax=Tanacetum cinerariifolium TaxID=118510 RepID=A0A699I2P3_TANCI|nr:acid phosphatase 1-like [Tanacetum cinerariifolium]
MLGRSYEMDIEMVSNEALEFAISVAVNEDGMDVSIFDIDETLLSNLPYYGQHGYGSGAVDLSMVLLGVLILVMIEEMLEAFEKAVKAPLLRDRFEMVNLPRSRLRGGKDKAL